MTTARPSTRSAARSSLLARRTVWPALVVAAVTLALDVRALLPGVGLWDTAEFQAIGPVLGIAHPTGYPSYTLLAWLASVVLQPFGDAAYRANLLSALLAATATGLTTVAVVQLTRRPAFAMMAGLALAAAPSVWRIGLRADPHALHFALAALLLVLLLRWREGEREGDDRAGRWLFLAAVVFAVSLGNHMLTVLLAPGIALFVLAVSPRLPIRRPRLVLGCAAAIAATTVALYLYLPIRSRMDPPLDYANPEHWDGVRYIVFGEQFRGTFTELPDLPTLVGDLSGRMVDELGVFAVLALIGVLAASVRRPAVALLTIPWFVVTSVFSAAYVNAQIERYYLGPLLVAAVWAALGVEALWLLALRGWSSIAARHPGARMDPATERAATPAAGPRALPSLLAAAATFLLLVPTALAVPRTLAQVDASDERYAREWLDATLDRLAPDAVVVSWWSYSTTLWYGQFVERRRPDVLVVDDRTMLDQELGDASDVVRRYLGSRPVYLIRLPDELREMDREFQLRPLRVPGGGVYEVLPPSLAAVTAGSDAGAPSGPRSPAA